MVAKDFTELMKKPSKKDLKKWEKMAENEIAEWKRFLNAVVILLKEKK